MDIPFIVLIIENRITALFSFVILVLFIYSIWHIKKGNNKSFIHHAPTTLTTVGILGTFVGIYIGLRGFKVSDIDGSIPMLLDGLKIAFITSILGMITALLVKAYQCIKTDENKQVDFITPEDIYGVLGEIRDIHKESKRESLQVLTELKNTISSDQDTSLVTQIQKMRTNIVDALSDLRNDFKTFAEKMAQDNSEALIKALEEVIRDFNAKINEQFGENFKQLNEAVGSMLDWQKEYKEQVELLNDTFKKTTDGIILIERSLKQIEGSVKEIQDELSPIPDLLKNLQNIVQIIFNETEELDEHLSAFSELKRSALEAFPVLKENLDNLSAEVASSVKGAIETTEEILNAFGNQLKEIADKQDKAITTSVENMALHIDQTLEQTKELLKESFTVFDAQMQEEVERTINTMGSGLASLSNKFVEDYSPLTEKLRSIVRIAEESGVTEA